MLAELLAGHPASALNNDAAEAYDDLARSRLQELGSGREGGEQQQIADLAGHLALRDIVIDHAALPVDLDLDQRVIGAFAVRAEISNVVDARFGEQRRRSVRA